LHPNSWLARNLKQDRVVSETKDNSLNSESTKGPSVFENNRKMPKIANFATF